MNDAPLLLDTCPAIWISHAEPISDAAMEEVRQTAWEIGLLMSRGKLTSTMAPQRWFQRLMQAPGVRLAEMSADILTASSLLPASRPAIRPIGSSRQPRANRATG
ncbi:MAG TPA: hypothetical protein VGY57_11125 [Vicinamibacterales bacterium]|jgi:PIN domain nuclease of toxin-antitoxin system|nr:hypothetical protein [Vicinamibacterales bacterium]